MAVIPGKPDVGIPHDHEDIMILTRVFALFCLGSALACQAQTPAPSRQTADARTKTVTSVRDDLKHGVFSEPLKTLLRLPEAEVLGDPELLTLRGIAAWGEALRDYSALAPAAAEIDLVRRARQALYHEMDRYADNPEWQAHIENAMAAMAGDVERCRKIARDLPGKWSATERLFERALSDFAAAGALRTRSKAEWCEMPECWELLANVHYFFVLKEGRGWRPFEKAVIPPGDMEKALPLPMPSDQAFDKLQARIDDLIRKLLSRGDALPSPARAAHCIADAILLEVSANGQIEAWIRQSRIGRLAPGPAPNSRDDAADVRPPRLLRLEEAVEQASENPLHAAFSLYIFAADRIGPRGGSGPRYSAYVITMPESPVFAASLLAKLGDTEELRPTRSLETARAAAARGKEAEILDEVMRACKAARLRRPLFSAAPAPIRAGFLTASKFLLQQTGADIGAGYEPLFRLLQEIAKEANTPEMLAKLTVARLRLSQLLITSDVPWDRKLGFKQASMALADLSKLGGLFSESQLAAFAALEEKLTREARQEGFPPTAFAVMNGAPFWSRDPFTRGIIKDPSVAVSPGGAIITTGPPTLPRL